MAHKRRQGLRLVLWLTAVAMATGAVLAVLAWGPPQLHSLVYRFQCYVYPRHPSGFIAPTPDYTGRWTYWRAHGERWREIQLKQGKRHGLGREWDEQGQLIHQRQWKDGKAHGEWLWWDEQGQKRFSMRFEEGKLCGRVRAWDGHGRLVSEGEYRDGRFLKLEGTFVQWEGKQKRLEETYKNGKWHGPRIVYDDEGRKEIEQHWASGRPDGLCTRWQQGRKVLQETYKHGKWHGVRTSWYHNGQKKLEQHWADGVPHGTATRWDGAGQLLWKARYDQGRLVHMEKRATEVKAPETPPVAAPPPASP